MAATRALHPLPAQQPLLDFLAPRLARPSPLRNPRTRGLHTAPAAAAASPASHDPSTSARTPAQKPQAALSQAQRDYLSSALRVNQAGELAATLIYQAQTPVLTRREAHLAPLMAHMYAQEAAHLRTFSALLATHRVRPTLLTPLWRVAATALGWSTALLSRQAAMACTEAVETEIGEHYNGQVRELLSWLRAAEERGERLGDELEALVHQIRVIRDEELEHLDHAVGEDAKDAEAYPVLTAVIRGGCRGAFWLSE